MSDIFTVPTDCYGLKFHCHGSRATLANRVAINPDFITHRWILRSVDVAAAAAPAAGTSELRPLLFFSGAVRKRSRCFVAQYDKSRFNSIKGS